MQKEQTALNTTHYPYHKKRLKLHDDIPHHTAISHHHFTPYALLHHTILHPFTLCSPSRPQHSTLYNMPFHITPYDKYISSVVSFNSALNTHLFSSGLWLLCRCAWSCVPFVSCVCVFQPHSASQVLECLFNVGFKLHFTSHYSTPHHIKHFHITHSITPHQKILYHATFHITPFHNTPFHITPPLHNIPHHITTYHMYHTTSHRHLMSHLASDHHILHLTYYTAVCLPPPLDTTTSQSTTYSTYSHSPHLAPFHIHNYSTPRPHSTSEHISHNTIFHITLHRSLHPTTISHHHILKHNIFHTTPTFNITAHFTP